MTADADRYVLATYFQENLKYVKPGQPVEVSLDMFPESIWRGNRRQFPSDEIRISAETKSEYPAEPIRG